MEERGIVGPVQLTGPGSVDVGSADDSAAGDRPLSDTGGVLGHPGDVYRMGQGPAPGDEGAKVPNPSASIGGQSPQQDEADEEPCRREETVRPAVTVPGRADAEQDHEDALEEVDRGCQSAADTIQISARAAL